MGLGERLNGIQEVSGSIPLISTKNSRLNRRLFFFFPKTGPPGRCEPPVSLPAARRGLAPVETGPATREKGERILRSSRLSDRGRASARGTKPLAPYRSASPLISSLNVSPSFSAALRQRSIR